MTSLARGLAVLTAFSDHVRGTLTIAQISSKTGIPRAAVRRCLHTLKQLGYVHVPNCQQLCAASPKVLDAGLFLPVFHAPDGVRPSHCLDHISSGTA